MQITSLHSLNAFLLPIKTVGVQVALTDCRHAASAPTQRSSFHAYAIQSGLNNRAVGCWVGSIRCHLNSRAPKVSQWLLMTTGDYL